MRPGGCIRIGLDIVPIARSSYMLAASTVAIIPRASFPGLKFHVLIGGLVEILSKPASNAMRSLLMYSVLAQGAYWQCLQVAFVFAASQSIPCLGMSVQVFPSPANTNIQNPLSLY